MPTAFLSTAVKISTPVHHIDCTFAEIMYTQNGRRTCLKYWTACVFRLSADTYRRKLWIYWTVGRISLKYIFLKRVQPEMKNCFDDRTITDQCNWILLYCAERIDCTVDVLCACVCFLFVSHTHQVKCFKFCTKWEINDAIKSCFYLGF